MPETPATDAPKSNGHLNHLLLSLIQASLPQETRMDGFRNIVTGLGVGNKDAAVSTKFCPRAPQTQATIENLYEQDDIFPLIVDRIPEHGTRKWIRMTGATDKQGRPDKDFGRNVIEGLEEIGGRETGGARTAFFELWRQHRLYGGALILVGADDGQASDQPLAIERVSEIKYLNVLTRWEINQGERNTDPLSRNFRRPEFYAAHGNPVKIHHTRVLRLPRHLIASDHSLRGTEGWDLPIIERVWEPLRQFGSLFGYAESIFQDLFQGVVTLKGLMHMLSSDDGSNAVMTRLQTMSLVRSSLNMIILDEGETYDRRNQAPTGLSDIMVRCMDRLAAAAKQPLSILFGQAPTGLSTDDAGGRRSFYDSVRNDQDRLLRGPLTRLIQIMIAAKKGRFKGKEPEQWSFDWAPLEEPDDKDVSTRRLNDAQTEEKLILNEILTPQEVRSRYINDPSCPYQLDVDLETQVDFPDPAADLALMPPAPGAQPGAQAGKPPVAPAQEPGRAGKQPQ